MSITVIVAVMATGLGALPVAAPAAADPPSDAYRAAVVARSPALYWRYDEASGTTIGDSSGNGRTGTYVVDNFANEGVELAVSGALSNNPDTAFGKSSTYYWYGGTFARRSTAAGLPAGGAARTVEGWAKFSGSVRLAGWGDFSIDAGSRALTIGAGGSTATIPVNGLELNDRKWHHIVVTYATGTFAGYVDGEPVGSVASPGTLNTDTTGPFHAGTINGGQSSGFFDELAVYPSKLTAARVKANFEASGALRPTGPTTISVAAGSVPNSLTATWSASTAGAPASQAGVEAYVVTAYAGTAARGSVSVAGTQTSVQLSGLAAGTYTVTVRGVNGFGAGAVATSGPFAVTGAAQTATGTILSRNPALYWRYGDKSGPIVADSSAQGHHGLYVTDNFANEGVELGVSPALSNDPDTSFGKSSTYYWYGAVFSRALSAAGLPGGGSNRTVEGWVRFNSSVVLARWGGFSVGASRRAIDIAVGSASVSIPVDTLELTDGRWHHVAVTLKASTFTGYVDGVAVGSVATPAAVDTATDGGFQAGAVESGQSKGFFDELAIIGRALTATEVRADFNATGASKPTAPTNVTASTVPSEPNRITASWSPSSAGVPPSQAPVEAYIVTAFAGSTVMGSKAVSGAHTQTVISGLPAGPGYTIKVLGVNAFGKGPQRVSAAVDVAGAASTYVGEVERAGPALYWRYGEPSGDVIADSSANGRDGQYVRDNFANEGLSLGVPGALTGDPDTAFGKGGTYYWYGATFARRFIATGLPAGANDRTVEGWVRFSNSITLASWGGFAVSATNASIVVGVDGQSATIPVPGGGLANGAWHHLALTFDGDRFTGFADGRQVGSVGSPAPLVTTTNGPFEAGAVSGNSSGYFDELAVYPVALTPTQVLNRFRAAAEAVLIDEGAAPTSVVVGLEGPTTVRRGRTNRFLVTLTNNGPTTVYGATGRLRVPAGITYQVISTNPAQCDLLIAYMHAQGLTFDEAQLRQSANCQPSVPKTSTAPVDLLFRAERLEPGQVVKYAVDLTLPTDGEVPLTVGLIPPQGSYPTTGDRDAFVRDPAVRAMIAEAIAQAGGSPPSQADIDGIAGALHDALFNAITMAFPIPTGLPTDAAGWAQWIGVAVAVWGGLIGSALLLEVGLLIFTVGSVAAFALALAGLLNLLVSVLGSFDPNDKLGPPGVGAKHWVSSSTPLRYVLRFENDPERASAPAQLVEVTDPLPAGLDETTVVVEEVLVGGRSVPLARQPDGSWSGTLDPGGGAAPIRATVAVDAPTRQVRARLWGQGTGTGQDAYADFLPPNDTEPEGEGEVAFTIRPKADAANGTVIVNGASITFDSHEGGTAIAAPTVSNKLDTVAPTSSMTALPPTSPPQFTVEWAATDTSGSGVKDYTVWVSTNGGPLKKWKANVTKKSIPYTGVAGSTYAFLVQARDATGNLEPLRLETDTQTTVG